MTNFNTMSSRLILLLSLILFSGCASHSRVIDRYANNAKKTIEIVNGKGDDAKVTKRISYYNNGRVQSELLINNGRPNGKATYYHPNGAIFIKGKHVNGLRDGKWIWTNTHGTIDSTHTFKNGKLDGKTFYYLNGELIEFRTYLGGDRHGEFKEFYPSGSKKVMGKYIKNLPDKTWTWYNEDKSKSRSVSFSEGVKHGNFKIWNDGQLVLTGQFASDQRTGIWKWGRNKKELDSLATYSAGVLNGAFKAWYSNEEPSTFGRYTKGKKDGQWKWWAEEGVLDSSKTFVNGQLNGLSKFYYKNEQLKSWIQYQLGKYDGESILYFPSGEIQSKTTFQTGIKNGPYEIWYSGDRPEEKGQYSDDKPHGKIQRWYSNGEPASIANYTEGKLDSLTQIFTLSGNIKKEIFYEDGNENARMEYHDNGRLKRVLIFTDNEIQYERKWNHLGIEETDEAYIFGTNIDSEFYLSGFLKYECIYKNGQKHGMEWWLDENSNPTQINLYLDGREVVRHEIAYETTE